MSIDLNDANPQQPSPEDDAAKKRRTLGWLEPPGIYADHFTLQVFSEVVVRIAFAEWMGDDEPPLYRTAVVMPLSDAGELVEVLQRALAEAAAEKAAEKKRE